MKKSNFIALILGTVSGMLFALGMCMALIPEWNAFRPGLVFGVLGLIFGLVTVIVWRRMEKKAPIHLSPKHLGTILLSVAGALMLGMGMCFCTVWGKLLIGVPVGIVGILLLLWIGRAHV